jgi:uncharacterized membrane protein YhaH (DUF805 family)|tara:strand:- start:214 stop:597 length:384 start_codon:yes stop_codon:yes gene_type:complete
MLATIQDVYKKSFSTNGRATRTEYWGFQLFYILIGMMIIVPAMSGVIQFEQALFPFGAFILITAPAQICLTVRRFHDLDRSGYWLFINFVPYLGGFVILIWFCFRGTDGPNQYDGDQTQRVPPRIPL